MREIKMVREGKKRGGKKKGDFPGVPTVGARRSKKNGPMVRNWFMVVKGPKGACFYGSKSGPFCVIVA